MTEPEVVAMWSPCCRMLRQGGDWEVGSMHNGLCRAANDGELGPTIRLVAHPADCDPHIYDTDCASPFRVDL
jgi:hypothetical protein